jgi:hypothetical protein
MYPSALFDNLMTFSLSLSLSKFKVHCHLENSPDLDALHRAQTKVMLILKKRSHIQNQVQNFSLLNPRAFET